MTEQEIFDHVYTFITKQGRASVDIDGMCAYRGWGGTACAAGCLLSDDEYSKEMEGMALSETQLPVRLKPHVDFIGYLQKAHDGAAGPFCPPNSDPTFMKVFHSDCASIAKRHNLTIPEMHA